MSSKLYSSIVCALIVGYYGEITGVPIGGITYFRETKKALCWLSASRKGTIFENT
jgi:hypothetical protein